jgi:hypothetical protein
MVCKLIERRKKLLKTKNNRAKQNKSNKERDAIKKY